MTDREELLRYIADLSDQRIPAVLEIAKAARAADGLTDKRTYTTRTRIASVLCYLDDDALEAISAMITFIWGRDHEFLRMREHFMEEGVEEDPIFEKLLADRSSARAKR